MSYLPEQSPSVGFVHTWVPTPQASRAGLVLLLPVQIYVTDDVSPSHDITKYFLVLRSLFVNLKELVTTVKFWRPFFPVDVKCSRQYYSLVRLAVQNL